MNKTKKEYLAMKAEQRADLKELQAVIEINQENDNNEVLVDKNIEADDIVEDDS